MTMHLIKGVCNLNTRKPKQKITKAKQIQLEANFKEYNKFLKSKRIPVVTFDEYVNQVYGKMSKKDKHVADYKSVTSPRPSSTAQYPSVTSASAAVCAKAEPKVYSGEQQLLGIATLHKSCLQPVFSKSDAVEIARMRRN